MADIYVEIGPMSYSKDTTKVPVKYAVGSQKLMRDTATAVVRDTKGFTPDKDGNTEGYDVNLTLSDITYGTYQDRPSVTCHLTGVVSTYPAKKMLTNGLTGKGTVGAGGKTVNDGDVRASIEEAVKATFVKSVLPYLAGRP
jgi:hypothetical protein